jgi:hypothetical protein
LNARGVVPEGRDLELHQSVVIPRRRDVELLDSWRRVDGLKHRALISWRMNVGVFVAGRIDVGEEILLVTYGGRDNRGAHVYFV